MTTLRTPATRHSRIAGLGAYRPRRGVGNDEICRRIDSSDEWITTRSGIRVRGFADKDETLLAMSVEAGAAALKDAGVDPSQVDCVLVASTSNLVQTPPLSIAVAHALGADNAGGFDVSAACVGFCNGLAVAGDMVSTGNAEHVLVIGVERMTDIVDPTDRGISFLFADGAGAAVVGPSATVGIGPVVRGADGDCLDALSMTAAWGDFRDDTTLPKPMLRMDGRRVFRWAVSRIADAARQALAAAGIGIDDLGAFIPHQANLRMIDILVDQLAVPEHVVVSHDVVTTGNTSAASVPLAMTQLLADRAVPSGAPALLIGFGSGLSYAGQVVLLP
ncbi:beta-ketoacyl-ACP synthase 3 [Kutzneria sp. NPDC051319]|uniref:beta-ketoacyl-ACP synthase 3 n=1 Tax=Kutzneria sp. NPDC051319 TaxID=3155047 RepID=UPI003413CC44